MKKIILVFNSLLIALFAFLIIFPLFNKSYATIQGYLCSGNGTTIWEVWATYKRGTTTISGPVTGWANSTASVGSFCGASYSRYFAWPVAGTGVQAQAGLDTVSWYTTCVDPVNRVVAITEQGSIDLFAIDISCHSIGYDGTASKVYAGCGSSSGYNNLGISMSLNDQCNQPQKPPNSPFCTRGGQTAHPYQCIGSGTCNSSCTLTGRECQGTSCVSSGSTIPNSPSCVGQAGCQCINDSDCAGQYSCGSGSNACNQYNKKCTNHQCVINTASPHATNTVACNGVGGASCPTGGASPPGTISNPQAAPFCQGPAGTNRASGLTFTWTEVFGATAYNVVYSGVNHSTGTNSLTIPNSACTSGPPTSCSFSYGTNVPWYVTTTVGSTTYTSATVNTTTANCAAAAPPSCPAGQSDPHYSCSNFACISVSGCGPNTCTGPSDTTTCAGGSTNCTTCNGPSCVTYNPGGPCNTNCGACSGGTSC